MIDLIRSAPYDTALLCITVMYVIAVFRLFRSAGRRDDSYAERMLHWQQVLQQAARERAAKSRPSAAE